jgi:glycine cleavage system H protein
MLPNNLKYTSNHMWFRFKGEKVVIGVTDYLTESVDEIILVSLPKIGEEIDIDDVFGCIESKDQMFDLVSPLCGEVRKANNLLKEDPNILLEDPYGDGWIVEIEVNDPCELDNLLSSEQYESEIEK